MTRFFDLGLIVAALLLAEPTLAEPLISDAFGLYDPATAAPERRDWSGWTDGATPQLVMPEEPDRLVIFAGPKSVVAGKDPGHVVAVVVDRFGNLVADGTPSAITVSGASTSTETTGGIADLLLSPRTQAADLLVGVTAGQRQSPQAMISIVADIASIQPRLSGPLPDVASDTPFEVVSSPLADRFGNIVPQGTGALILLRHADGSYSLAQGVALQGRVLVRFVARDIPGLAMAAMTLGAQSSDSGPLSIKTPAAAGMPALELESLEAIRAQRLTLGPFLTTDGYALVDGAQVTVTADLSNGAQVTEDAWVRDGEISLLLPIADPAAVTRFAVQSSLGPMDLTPDWHAAKAKPPVRMEPAP